MHNCFRHVVRLSNTTIVSCTCTVADKKDMFILGIISACTRNEPMTECSRRKVQADRQKCHSSYYFMSRFVCAKAFVWLVGISPDKLYALAKHYKTNGQVPQQLRAGGRKNNTASLTLVDAERIVRFIKQYAEDHAVSLPGRVPGFKCDDIRLLPPSCPKSQVYRLYEASASADTASWLHQRSRSCDWSCAPLLLLPDLWQIFAGAVSRATPTFTGVQSDPGGKGWAASRTCSSS